MIRLVAFVALIALLIAGAVWMAENPGAVTVHWLGWRIDTSVPFLLLALVVLVVLFLVVRGILLGLLGIPGAFGRRRREKRRRKGLIALGDGLAALIAEDTYTVRRKAAEAQDLLGPDVGGKGKRNGNSAATLLLARAAVLGDDAASARQLNTRLLEHKETEIAGLRGLMDEALSEGRMDEARGYAAKAFDRNPRTAWAAQALFDAQVKTEQWDDALKTLETTRKSGVFTGAEVARRKATILIVRCDAAAAGGQSYEATRLARQAVDADPDYLPARIRLARSLGAEGQVSKAAAMIEDGWRRAPNAELAALYMGLWPDEPPLKRVSHAEHLAETNPEHLESRLLVASAALDADLWGQARARLKGPVDAGVRESRLARLMARLEEGEHGDLRKAMNWMALAADLAGHEAQPWRCTACGAASAQWTTSCGACGSFATVTWGGGRALVPHEAPDGVPTPSHSDQRAAE